MLGHFLFYMLLPLLVFSVGFLLVMWPGVLLSYQGTEDFEFRRGVGERVVASLLIAGGVIWLQLFLSGWAFYVGHRVHAEILTDIGAGWFCYAAGFFFSLAPTGIPVLVTDLRPPIILVHIFATGMTYFITLLWPDVLEKICGCSFF